jgi:hypothetical protein
MKRLMLATVAGAAMLAGAGAASAQNFNGDGAPNYSRDYDRGWAAPGVGVQVAPTDGWVGAPVAGVGPGFGYSSPDWNYQSPTPYNSAAPRGGTYKSRAFKSQERLPQSPPEGGY